METAYKVIDGTSYHVDVDYKVIDWLETSRNRKQRIRIFYGDVTSGRDWHEEFGTIGYVGRSTGTTKVPLLIRSSRSFGGEAILDQSIVRIDTKGADGKIRTVYQNPLYNMGKIESSGAQVLINGTVYANCPNYESAIRLAAFMRGERWSK